ncbi:TRAP transporter small permease [Vibrio algivorus]|uniref:TRAP transporter small permease protein n=1 Tax=Vibrio algivorus TaxID=1667024 RepID=A0ABQ6ERS9_9VIBR|nr:TRAP transporter small permease [Vibrio algivorus]GLT15330.1 putative TRAP transporter small permease protein [Vibrio algivorus]
MKNIINRLINGISIISMLIMVTLVFMNVLLRYFFDSGLPWSEEIARIAFVWVVFLGIMIANRDRDHLQVDIVTSRLSGVIGNVVFLFQRLITVFVLISVIIGGSKLIILTKDQGLPSTGIPTPIIYIAGVVACSILLLTIIASIFSKKGVNS